MMNFKKGITLLFTIITAQFFSQGLKINDTIDYNKSIKTAKLTTSRSITTLDSRYTLEKFLPYVHQQLGNECLSYALSTCRTICYARDNKYDNINKISFESFSPHYSYIVYKRASNDTITQSLKDNYQGINELGFCKIKKFEYPKYYPFTNKHITGFPSLDALKTEAIEYKFSSFEKIDLTDKNKLKIIKELLHKNIPAVASFNPWPENLKLNSKSWSSSLKIFKEKEKVIGHAVTLIGYDDSKEGGSFLIVNSWGKDFGDNGKIWIPYKSFFKYIYKVIFTFTDQVKDYANYNSYSKQGSNTISTNYNSTNSELSFDWAIRMPILNNLGIYIGDTSIDGKRNGNGEFKANNSASYKGTWKDDVPFGNGTAELNKDSKYIANWKNEFELPEFYESVYSSVFKYKGSDKYVKVYYVGGFKGALSSENFHGIGEFYVDGKKIYEGEWLNGEKSGKGTYYSQFSDGSNSKYQGEWLNNKKNGKGVLYNDGKKYYEGEWENDQMNGKGISYYNGKKRYEGEWLNGEKSGKGTYHSKFSDGSKYKYVGEWLNNQENGKGVTYLEDGSIYEDGIYKNGEFEK